MRALACRPGSRAHEVTRGMRLQGKAAIVTGAGPGIGEATALRLAEEGAAVTCVDLEHADPHRRGDRDGGRQVARSRRRRLDRGRGPPADRRDRVGLRRPRRLPRERRRAVPRPARGDARGGMGSDARHEPPRRVPRDQAGAARATGARRRVKRDHSVRDRPRRGSGSGGVRGPEGWTARALSRNRDRSWA